MYSSIFLTWQKGTTITSENCIAHLEKKGEEHFLFPIHNPRWQKNPFHEPLCMPASCKI